MEHLITITSSSEIDALLSYLDSFQYVAFDTETTGLSKESEIIGFSVSAETNVGYYVVLSYWDKESAALKYFDTMDRAKEIMLYLQQKALICHNATFDCAMVENNFGVSLLAAVHTDTLLLGHLLDENRHNGLKELGVTLFGDDAAKEQHEMKQSVVANGGKLTRDCYELYKADYELLARYGAKDTILTLKLFYEFVPQLYEQKLDVFFYEEETMPQLWGPTYDLNTTGLRVDTEKLQKLRQLLETESLELRAFIENETKGHTQDKYPGTGVKNTFNIKSCKHLSWLLFIQLENEFHTLTKEGRNVCKSLGLRLPYTASAKREFIYQCTINKGSIYQEPMFNPKTQKMGRPKKIGDPWNYIACDKTALKRLADKYKWVHALLEYAKNMKILNTYVIGIQNRMSYGVIHPSFLQHGTTSGRYSSRNPNFQNLPRDDKRVKACIISRPGKVFVGADYEQLEPRVFASFSGDERLLNGFKSGDDFYSTIGMEVFGKVDCTSVKDGSLESFGVKYKKLRDIAKVIALSVTYGTTAPKMAPAIGKSLEEAQQVIDNYFESFPKVRQLMVDSHNLAKEHGAVYNLYGRPRRMPKAALINKLYPNTEHSELPYDIRNLLNLAINHRIQSTGASIINRAGVEFCRVRSRKALENPSWVDVKIVMQIHDELVIEAPESLGQQVVELLRDCMENTIALPGVALIAKPKIAYNLADLK